jgi:hypothetical protein
MVSLEFRYHRLIKNVKGSKMMNEVKRKSEGTKGKGVAKKTLEESKFTNQNWVKVLDEIWRYAPNRYGRGSIGYEDSHPLAIKLKITGYELMLIASFLEEQGLINYDQQQHNWIQITSKGFDVALQNRNAEANRRVSKGSLFLSLAITVFALTSLLIGIGDILERWFISILIVIVLVAGGMVINKIYG